MKIYLEREELILENDNRKFNFNIENDYKEIVKLITKPSIKKENFDTEQINDIKNNKQVELILEYVSRLEE